jgi:uncharacterized protein YndB with AHSA1/START domain
MNEQFVVRRETRVAAPPATVFAFLTDPEKILRWMGAVAAAVSAPWSNGQNRRANLQAEAGQTPNVRTWETRSAPGTRRRPLVTSTSSEVRQTRRIAPRAVAPTI